MGDIKMASSSPSPKKKARWSKSVEVNGITKSVSVQEVENGYIVEQSTYGRDSTKKDAEYKDECKKYISKTNPLEGTDKEEDNEDEGFSLKGFDTIVIE